MPDENQQQQQAGLDASTNAPQQQQQQTPLRIEDLPEPVQKMIKDLRQEAAGYRVELKKFNEMQQQRLAEQGNFKELAEQRAADIAALTPYKEQAEMYEKTIRESNSSRIATLREDMRALIPAELSPLALSKWLDTALPKLTMPTPPNLDAGAGSGGGATPRLTEEQKQMAARFGMSEAQYIEALKRAQQRQG